MKRDNKKALYESIMASVAKEVKKALNEYSDLSAMSTWDEDQSDSDFVDLGLSVKWAKYNLGATPGRRAKDWYGDYYAWGETEPNKSIYKLDNYKYADFRLNFIKYNEKDHKSILAPNDDAATVNCGRPWRMPTKEELEELLAETTNRWVEDYNGIEGLNGIVFTSKVNGNKLFIPAAGYCSGANIHGDDSRCDLWSSSLLLDYPKYAYCAHIFNDTNFRVFDMVNIEYGDRYFGFSIRPVC